MYPTGYQHPSYTYGTQASQNAARAAAEAAATAAATAAFRATGRPSSAVAATINSGYVPYQLTAPGGNQFCGFARMAPPQTVVQTTASANPAVQMAQYLAMSTNTANAHAALHYSVLHTPAVQPPPPPPPVVQSTIAQQPPPPALPAQPTQQHSFATYMQPMTHYSMMVQHPQAPSSMPPSTYASMPPQMGNPPRAAKPRYAARPGNASNTRPPPRYNSTDQNRPFRPNFGGRGPGNAIGPVYRPPRYNSNNNSNRGGGGGGGQYYRAPRPANPGPWYNLTPGSNNFESPKSKPKKPSVAAETKTLFCTLCNRGPMTDVCYAEHLRGKQHLSKMARQEAGEELSGTYKHPEDKPYNYDREVMSRSGAILRCPICQVPCISTLAYRHHLKGSRHASKKRQLKAEGAIVPSIVPDFLSTNIAEVVKVAITHEFTVLDIEMNTPDLEEQERRLSAIPPLTEEQEAKLAEVERYETVSIGHDFIEEVVELSGKSSFYLCNLCDTKFNDPMAKFAHLIGKKHNVNYKRNVDPSMLVPSAIKSDRKIIDAMYGIGDGLAGDKNELNRYSVDLNPFAIGNSEKAVKHSWDLGDFKADLVTFTSQLVDIQYSGEDKTYLDFLLEFWHSKSIVPRERIMKILDLAAQLELATVSLIEVLNEQFLNIRPNDDSQIRLLKSRNISLERFGTMQQEELFEKMTTVGRRIKSGGGAFNRPSELVKMIIVGPLGKGTLLIDEEVVTLVALLNFQPSDNLLNICCQVLSKYLPTVTVKKTFEIEKIDGGVLVMVKEIEGGFEVKVQILFTSPTVRGVAEKQNVYLGLNQTILEDALYEVRRVRWFREKMQPPELRDIIHPHYQFTIRLIRLIVKKWKMCHLIADGDIEVLLERISWVTKTWMPVGVYIRHFFEYIGACAARKNFGVGDCCRRGFEDAFRRLNIEERRELTTKAQAIFLDLLTNQFRETLLFADFEATRESVTVPLCSANELPVVGSEVDSGTVKQEEVSFYKTTFDDLQQFMSRDSSIGPDETTSSTVDELPILEAIIPKEDEETLSELNELIQLDEIPQSDNDDSGLAVKRSRLQ